MFNKYLIIVVPFALSACLAQADIQARYNSDNGDCRGFAEENIDRYLPKDKAVSAADRNAQMVTLFSDCMGKQGWQVAKPRKADDVASTAPLPSPNYPGGFPSVTSTARPAAPAAVAPAPAVTSPMQSAPSLPSSSSLPQSGQAPAMYQPTYGTGPARNF